MQKVDKVARVVERQETEQKREKRFSVKVLVLICCDVLVELRPTDRVFDVRQKSERGAGL